MQQEPLTTSEISAAVYAYAILVIPIAILLSFGLLGFSSKKDPPPKGEHAPMAFDLVRCKRPKAHSRNIS